MKPFIIAEIGINHNGDLSIARQLIDLAVSCGCDAVKFQKRTIDIVYAPEFLDSPRQSPWGSTQRDQKEGLEFGRKQYDRIDEYCKSKKIEWFASAWDIQSQLFLRRYDCTYNKIASPMLTHLPLLETVASEGKHTFISTGMSTFDQIDQAVSVFRKARCPFTLMHCVSVYPCPDGICNIQMVRVLRERHGCPVGYSGHELGILPSVLTVLLGAVAIERHITLDRSMYGSDQSASLEKRGLELLVRDARSVSMIIGNGNKALSQSELEVERKLRYFREPELLEGVA